MNFDETRLLKKETCAVRPLLEGGDGERSTGGCVDRVGEIETELGELLGECGIDGADGGRLCGRGNEGVECGEGAACDEVEGLDHGSNNTPGSDG